MSQKPCQNCQKTISFNAQFCPYCGQPQTFSPLLTGQLPASAMLDNRYAVDALVGRGGMGAVYRAVDTRLTGRVCAIKEMSVLTLPPQERESAIHSFRQEAQLLATLQHPNLPKVHDFFQDGTSGRHYLVMDFVQGDTLEDLLQRQGRPFPEQQVRAWGWQLCDVLTYLHSRHPPIIFRDLKPQNIMLEQNGQLKLIDFGIARFFQPAKTQDTQAFGTIGYSPPEQHGRGQTDARSDVYSLGATLWRLLTAQDPGDNPYQLPGVRRYNSSVSAELESVVQRAMQLQPDARYPTALEFGNALQGRAAAPTPKGDAKTSPSPQRPVAVWVALVALLLVVGGGAGLFWFNEQNTPAPAPTMRPSRTPDTLVAVAVEEEGETAVIPATFTPTAALPDDPPEPTPTETPSPSPTPTEEPTVTPTATSAIVALPSSIIGVDGMEMLLVPAGEFIMGSTSEEIDLAVSLCRQSGNSCPRSSFTNELPQRVVYLSSYYIDALEITNNQYRACVDARVCAPPSDSGAPDARYRVSNYYNQAQYGSYPVVRIRWEDAQTYCQWVGRRLPTEAEWEKAARGTDGRIFPWGNAFENRRANTEDGGGDQLRPVGSYPDGRSPYGVYDMAGNVWEYVADFYSDTYYYDAPSRDPQGPNTGSVHVLRGGSYSDFKEYARVTNRGTPHTGSTRSGFRGFRCAQSAD